MIYTCDRCHYIFAFDPALMEKKGENYRCIDCGKFAVREANSEECDEFNTRQSEYGVCNVTEE